GSSTTRYYLSPDTMKDAADLLLTGARSVDSLAQSAGSSGSVQVTIPPDAPAGSFYLLACADDLGDNLEDDETNNCLASAGRVDVSKPALAETLVDHPPPDPNPRCAVHAP